MLRSAEQKKRARCLQAARVARLGRWARSPSHNQPHPIALNRFEWVDYRFDVALTVYQVHVKTLAAVRILVRLPLGCAGKSVCASRFVHAGFGLVRFSQLGKRFHVPVFPLAGQTHRHVCLPVYLRPSLRYVPRCRRGYF